MFTIPLVHRIRRGDWVDRVITLAQVAVGAVAIIGIVGWITLNPFLLLSFIFAQPIVALGIALFIFAAFFFERAFMFETYDPGEIIFRQDTPARSIYVIKSGKVEVSVRHPNGEVTNVLAMGSGEYVGLAALAPGFRYRLTAKTLTRTELIRIRPRDFVTIFGEIPEVRNQIPALRAKILDAIEREAPELRKEVEQFIIHPDLVRALLEKR